MTTLKTLAGIFVLAAFFTTGLKAQSKNEAIEAYNQGVNLMKTDIQGAISSFEKSIQISEQVGDSAVDIKDKASSVLPDLYYQKAYKAYSEKNYAAAIAASKATSSVAAKYNNDKTKGRAETLLNQLYLVQATNYFNNNQNELAIASFDSALLINPDNSKALLNKALVYRKMNNSALFGETIDKAIEKAGNDTVQAAQSKKLAVDYYRLAGTKANTAKKYDEAITSLNTAIKYGQDKDVYYQLANVFNKQKKFDDAAASAQKGLDLETGDATAKAKFFWELGLAQAGKGDKESACGSFKSSSYGQFLAPSKAQLTNLKCGGAAAAPAK
jgi:tetratricopeptide (TPR) repeat protein